jgi:hypothetical protein
MYSSGTSVEILDALPMFHQYNVGASLLQTAFLQADAHGKARDCEVCGYYTANERENERELAPLAKVVGHKVHSNCEQACVLLVDNNKIMQLGAEVPGLVCFTKENKSEKWAPTEPGTIVLGDPARTAAGLPHMVAEKVHRRLADFEMHLEDIGSKDWFNPDLITE